MPIHIYFHVYTNIDIETVVKVVKVPALCRYDYQHIIFVVYCEPHATQKSPTGSSNIVSHSAAVLTWLGRQNEKQEVPQLTHTAQIVSPKLCGLE